MESRGLRGVEIIEQSAVLVRDGVGTLPPDHVGAAADPAVDDRASGETAPVVGDRDAEVGEHPGQ